MAFMSATSGEGYAARRMDSGTLHKASTSGYSFDATKESRDRRQKWSLGIMADNQTDEVPGSILLMSDLSKHNAPLGMNDTSPGTHSSSLSRPHSHTARSEAMFGRHAEMPDKKRTANGKIILEPQPEESMNDPLNWSVLRRDAALLSLGFYCMVGGGMTPILAAGFTNVANTYHVTIPQVALTTGLYMMGLGVGSVIASPTAIAFGKRPVYLAFSLVFLLTAVWCALSPNYASLVVARVIQGIAVSPVECLPSATIAEIFYLHERAYRLGIYTLLLLGGKNLVPLVSAAIIQSLSWQWVFWIVAIIVGFCFFLLFFLVPETFWDRTPRPHQSKRRSSVKSLRRYSSHLAQNAEQQQLKANLVNDATESEKITLSDEPQRTLSGSVAHSRQQKRARFTKVEDEKDSVQERPTWPYASATTANERGLHGTSESHSALSPRSVSPRGELPQATQTHSMTLPHNPARVDDYFSAQLADVNDTEAARHVDTNDTMSSTGMGSPEVPMHYTKFYRSQPQKSFTQSLKPYSGRLNHASWLRVAFRPFILFAYPAILWSAVVYSLSVGWLIVLSESVSSIYRNKATYNFSALSTGLIYISPFIGGILGTVVAGKVSDIIVRYMSKRNGGIYEPEFRLVMALPVALCTTIGLMGYGWSAQERDSWIVPTVFFGIISFGCSLGSTTAITFAVDSYRQYAGEALVTLNFSKNIFHGLVFSLFFNSWLQADGPKDVFLALGGIQLAALLFTVPMYVYGKRARMWTVRRNFMEKF